MAAPTQTEGAVGRLLQYILAGGRDAYTPRTYTRVRLQRSQALRYVVCVNSRVGGGSAGAGGGAGGDNEGAAEPLGGPAVRADGPRVPPLPLQAPAEALLLRHPAGGPHHAALAPPGVQRGNLVRGRRGDQRGPLPSRLQRHALPGRPNGCRHRHQDLQLHMREGAPLSASGAPRRTRKMKQYDTTQLVSMHTVGIVLRVNQAPTVGYSRHAGTKVYKLTYAAPVVDAS
eukprot:469934-Prorocentrum_minimum.AAC.1